MKWIRILLFMSLLLAAVNGYLLYSIHNMYRSVNYLDEEMITDTVELLSRSGIDVSPRIIPEKITQRQVWEGSLGESWEEYCLQAAMLLSGSRGTDRFSLHMMVNGLNVTDTESGDRFAFYDSDLFSFRFLGGGREEFTPADLESAGLQGDSLDKMIDQMADSKDTLTEEVITQVLNGVKKVL